jgi:hypothetical protein
MKYSVLAATGKVLRKRPLGAGACCHGRGSWIKTRFSRAFPLFIPTSIFDRNNPTRVRCSLLHPSFPVHRRAQSRH